MVFHNGLIRLLLVLSLSWMIIIGAAAYSSYPKTSKFGGIPSGDFIFWSIVESSELSEGTGVKASKQQVHSALVNAAIAEDFKAVRRLAEVIKNGEYQPPKYSVKTNYSLLAFYAIIPVILMWLLTLSCLWVRQGFELEKNNA